MKLITFEDVDKDIEHSENVSYRKIELPVHNIVLVGTKVDLVQRNPERRQVSFHQAVEFAYKYRLAGVVETSSKYNHAQGIDEAFGICAINCVDQGHHQRADDSQKMSFNSTGTTSL